MKTLEIHLLTESNARRNTYNIICITYCWNDGKPGKALSWDYETQDSSLMIEEFDKIVKQADLVIGQNSDSFDIKHINTQRLMHGLTPMPEWATQTDDLLKQVRYPVEYLKGIFEKLNMVTFSNQYFTQIFPGSFTDICQQYIPHCLPCFNIFFIFLSVHACKFSEHILQLVIL